jgi:hypothetical protein
MAAQRLPFIHIMIGNMKTFLNGTFHGVSDISKSISMNFAVVLTGDSGNRNYLSD